MTKKSRDLSIIEYFERLQLEYIVAELRRKIYPKKRDKEYYERVMEGKKDKIEDISVRNQLDSIFTDKEILSRYYSQVYREGLPDFTYRSEKERKMLEEKDIENYYCIGESFKVKISENEYKIGELRSVDRKSKIAKVKLRYQEEIITCSIGNISRIL